MQIIPWDPSILLNDKFQKLETTFASLQRRQWDPRILLSYLNSVDNLGEIGDHWRNEWIRMVQQNMVEKKFEALCGSFASRQEGLGGEYCHVPTFFSPKC